MEELGDAHQMKRIPLNAYTKGQLNLFVKTYQTYDLHPILKLPDAGEQITLKLPDEPQARSSP